MDRLQDILARRRPEEPREIQLIKDFVRKKFDEVVGVRITEREIIISAHSASLASALRASTVEIQAICQTDKRLVFRIGRA